VVKLSHCGRRSIERACLTAAGSDLAGENKWDDTITGR